MTYEQLLNNLKKLRKQRGISLRELEKLVGISATYLSYIENGKNVLSMKKFLKICDALYIEPKKLFEEGERDFNEYTVTASRLRSLSEREFRVVKDLVMLLSLSAADL